jgi:hypothetical protein
MTIDPATISLDDMVIELKREIRIRTGIYPRWVMQGKIKPEVAELQLGRMQAVLIKLLSLQDPPLL